MFVCAYVLCMCVHMCVECVCVLCVCVVCVLCVCLCVCVCALCVHTRTCACVCSTVQNSFHFGPQNSVHNPVYTVMDQVVHDSLNGVQYKVTRSKYRLSKSVLLNWLCCVTNIHTNTHIYIAYVVYYRTAH